MEYRVLGRESYCLPVFILVPLAMARQKRDEAGRRLAAGDDPAR